MTMPTFFVAGVPKGGTNTLLLALGTHPDVYVPADLKEPMFHFWYGNEVAYRFHGTPPVAHAHQRDLDAYRRVFAPGEGRTAVGEGSVHYFASAHAAENLARLCPDARIVVVLRDPVARAISHHAFNQMRGVERRSFDDAIAAELADDDPESLYPTYRYVGNGMYGAHLARYLDLFDRSQVLVLRFDDLAADVADVVARTEAFIGVEVGRSDLDGGFANETVSGGRLMGATRYLRTDEGRVGAIARRVERAAGESRAYRTVKQKVKVAARRGRGTAPARPEVSAASRLALAELFRADSARLAHSSGLDVSGWSTATPLSAA